MSNRELSVVALLSLILTGSGLSQNIMWVDSVSAGPAQTVQFSLKVSNTQSFVAFQADIILPSSLTYVANSAQLTARSNGHTLAASLVNPQTLRVIAFSFSGNPFLGNSGAVLTFACQTRTQPGTYPIDLVNPILGDSMQINILTAAYPGQFILLAPDIRLNVDSLDFGSVPLGQSEERSLVISNVGTSPLSVTNLSSTHTEVRFLDTTAMVVNPGGSITRVIRFQPVTKGIKTGTLRIRSNDPDDSLKVVPFRAHAFAVNEIRVGSTFGRSGYETTLRIRINNMEPFVAFEFHLLLPSAMRYVSGSVQLIARQADHLIFADTLAGNVLRVISFSPTNAAFTGNDGDIVQFTFHIQGAGGVYSIPVSNAIIGDSAGTNIISASYGGSLEIAAPRIQFSSSVINFDSVSIRDTVRRILQITNVGTDTLRVTSISINNSSFVLETPTVFSLIPGENHQARIRFHNPIKGRHEARMVLRHNDVPQDPSYVDLVATAFAPNRLSVVSQLGRSQDTIALPFSITNTEPFVAFQFDVSLPSGIQFIPGSAQLTSRAQNHSISAGILPNGDLRILAFSLTQTPFLGDSGQVIRIRVRLEPDSGNYPVRLGNVIIGDSSNRNIATGFDNGFVRIIAPPVVPTLVSPLDRSVGQRLSVTLRWSRAARAESYHVQLATDSLFITPVLNDSSVVDTMRSVSGLQPLTTYYWRVQARNIGGTSGFTQPWRFRTLGVPTQVALISPPNNAINLPTTVTCLWQRAFDQTLHPVSGGAGTTDRIDKGVRVTTFPEGTRGIGTDDGLETVSRYWFELVMDTTAMAGLVRDTTLTDTTKTVSDLTNLTAHYWRVRANNEIGWGVFSPWWKFTTIIAAPARPTLTSPSNGSINQPITLALSWNSSDRAGTYHLQVATDTVFIALVVNDSTLIDTSRQVGPLTNLTRYYWRVRAKNIGGTSTYSETWNFTTTIAAPAMPALLSPTNGSIGQLLSISLQWNRSARAESYHVQLATDSLFITPVLNDSSVVDTMRSVSGLQPLTTYYWRVQAKNIGGTSGFTQPWRFRTLGVPTQVVLVSPPNNAIYLPTTVTCVWRRALDQTLRATAKGMTETDELSEGLLSEETVNRYWFESVTDTTTMAGLVRDTTLTDTTKTVSGLTHLTAYYWRVRANNEIGWGVFSPWWKFTTIIAAPARPTLTSPSNGSINQPITLALSWNSSDRAGTYHLQVATDTGFIALVVNDSTLIDTSRQVGPLTNLTRYYWRVRAKNIGGTSAYSEVWNFTTTIAAPAMPVLLSPANGSIGQLLSLTLQWNRSARAESYHVQLATDSLFITPVLNDSSVVDTMRSVSGLQPLTTYYWRVQAKNISGTSGFTQPWRFRTLGVPTQVVLVSPPNNAVNLPTTVICLWQRALDQTLRLVSGGTGATDGLETVNRYWFESVTDTTTMAGLVRDTILTDTTKTLDSLTHLTAYYWRVRANNEIGWGVFSPWWKFTTIIAAPAMPVLLSPANGSIGQLLNITVQWSRATRAESYHVQVATDSLFITPVLNDSSVVDTMRSVSGLQPLTTYYWRVQAKNIGGTSGFTQPWRFRTLGVPTQVVLVSPSNNAVNLPTTVTCVWRRALDQTLRATAKGMIETDGLSEGLLSEETVNRYWFESVTDTTTMANLLRDTTLTDTTKSLTGLVNSTAYYWRVRANNEIGWGVFSPWWKFTTIIAAPATPTLAAPQNGAINQPTTLVLRWNTAPRATLYHLQAATDTFFTTPIVNDSTLTDTLRQVGPLANQTHHYWRVKAKNIGGESPFSETWNFTTIVTLPTQVQLVAPANGARIDTDTVVFFWRQSEPEVNRYWFELALDSNFASRQIDSLLTDTSKIVRQLINNQQYWWRAKAHNDAGWGPFSDAWTFTPVIVSVNDAAELPREFRLHQNYPNPFNPSTTIRYELPKESRVLLKVFNILGQEVATLVDEVRQAGRYSEQWNAGNVASGLSSKGGYASGVYFYRLQAGDFVETKKLILLR